MKPWILPPKEERGFFPVNGKDFVSAGSRKYRSDGMKVSTGMGGWEEMAIWKHLAKVGVLGCGTISQGKQLSPID